MRATGVCDSLGYLHVITGPHGANFYYAQSLAPNSTGAWWTNSVPVLQTGAKFAPGAERGRQTYVAFLADRSTRLSPGSMFHRDKQLLRMNAVVIRLLVPSALGTKSPTHHVLLEHGINNPAHAALALEPYITTPVALPGANAMEEARTTSRGCMTISSTFSPSGWA